MLVTNPLTISKLQQSVREESYETYNVYSDAINKQNEQFMTPKWVGSEVTEDQRFSSKQLSQRPYTEIEEYEKYTI